MGHNVVIPLVPGFQPLDVVGPHEVFAGANDQLRPAHETHDAAYRVVLVAAQSGAVVGESGLALTATQALPEQGPIGTLIMPGGSGCRRAVSDSVFIDWVRRGAHPAGRGARGR